MDRVYIQERMKQWANMGEPAQHAWMRREIPGHYDDCSLCQKYVHPDGRPKKV